MNSPMNFIDPNGMYPDSWQRPGETAVQYEMRMYSPELYDLINLGGVGIGCGGEMNRARLKWLTNTGRLGTTFYGEEAVSAFKTMATSGFKTNGGLLMVPYGTYTIDRGEMKNLKINGYSVFQFGEFQGYMIEQTIGGDINSMLNEFTHNRAGNGGYMSKESMNALIALDLGTFNFVNAAAAGNSVMKAAGIGTAATIGSAIVGLALTGNVIHDMRNNDRTSYGDYGRLFMNGLFLGASVVLPPFVIGGILDNNSFFEPAYLQLDIYEQTNIWIYYNMYTKEFNHINFNK